MKELQISQMIAPSVARLLKQGMEVRACDNFSQVEGLFQKTGRERQTPMFDVSRNDFTKAQAFWLFLEGPGGIVGGSAARFYDLEGESIDDFLRRTSKHQYGFTEDPILRVARPIVDEFQGRLIYLGELEFFKENRGNLRILRDFIIVLQGLAAMKWPQFDWMYAFIPDEHYILSRYYSFTWQCPNAITWRKEPTGRRNDHWVMAFPSSHFEHLVASRARGLVGHRPK